MFCSKFEKTVVSRKCVIINKNQYFTQLHLFQYYLELQIQKMNSQMNSADNHSLKLAFSNLHCKINLSDSALFAFVIRIGKTSSKYTEKKQIADSILEFDSVLELPINQSLLSQQNPKKEKCEIMLYKFRMNREKQSKELVGMASVTVSSEMFQGESKKLRLTNSFDKEAYVQSKMKIQLGQADVLFNHVSQLSSFQVRSEDHSLNNELAESRAKQNTQASPTKNHVKIGLITSNSRKSLRQASSEKSKGDNSFLDLLIRTENESSPLVPSNNTQSEQAIKKQQSPVKIEAFDSINQEIEEENHKLKEMCQQLQQQNKALKTTISILQNQALNQSMVSNKSASSQNPNIPKPGGSIKKSPMIKKNATITVIPSFSKFLANGNVLTEDLINQATQTQALKKAKGPKKGQIIRAQGSKLGNSRDHESQKFPYFEERGSRIIEQTLKFSRQNLDMPLHLTFAGERLTQRNRFSVTSVIQVKYTPAINYDGSNGLNKSLAHSSISEIERRNCRSYTKFNGKKKYQIVGAIKNENENSQINMSVFDQDFDRNHKRQGGSIIIGKPDVFDKNEEQSFNFNNQKQNHLNGVASKGASKETNFLDFLKEKDENPFQKNPNETPEISTPKASQSKLPMQEQVFYENKRQMFAFVDGNGQRKSRLTLEDLDIKTEELFRRNERDLKISNTKITEENRKLKEERKILEQQIQQKKGLSHQQFEVLKNQISQLKLKIQQSVKIKQQSEQKCSQMGRKFTTLEEENAKLKKDLKQQKAKYDYYFKMSNINDDKEKEKERENIGPWEKGLTNKKNSNKLHSETSSPGELSKALSRNDRSMTSISNFNKEDGIKMMTQENKSLKKVDFELERNEDPLEGNSMKKMQQNGEEFSKPPTSSTAVSKLKMHIKPSIPKSPMNGVLSQIQSPANSMGSGNLGALMSGLMGTGQTIVEGQKPTNFFSKK